MCCRYYIEPTVVRIEPGTFIMGTELAEREESPVHDVHVDKAFELGETEVTFDEYSRFAYATGRKLPDDEGWGRGSRPVINVSWFDAQEYE